MKKFVQVSKKVLFPILAIVAIVLAVIALNAGGGVNYGAVPTYQTLVYQGGTANLSAENVTALKVTSTLELTAATGNVTFTGGTSTATVTHSLGVAPSRVLLSVRGSPGTASSNVTGNPIYVDITTANTTAFKLYSGASTNQTVQVDWIALK